MPVFDAHILDTQLLNGATTVGRRCPSCGPHAPHSDGLDDHETLSASTPSDDFSEIFDMEGLARDYGTDVTTPSESSSEEKRPQTRPSVPTLVHPAAETHDHDGDSTYGHDGDCDMPDRPSHEPPDPNLWPTVSGPQPPRDTVFRVEGSSPSSPPADMRPPPPPKKKRTRELKSREETGKVREIKSCTYCRMNKSACDSNPICAPCAALPHGEEICIRGSLEDLVPPTLERWNWNNPYCRMPSHESRSQNCPTLPLSIFFSEDILGPCLNIRVHPVPLPIQRNSGAQHSGFTFAPFDAPSEKCIYEWMVQQIRADGSQDFETEMDKLLVHFVHPLGMRAELTCPTPKALLTKLLRMRCMWKLWSCRQMFVQTHPRSPAVPFDLRYASIQDFLRLLAAREISVLEHQILGEIDNHPFKADNELVMKWFLLWQMLLIYRQSLDLTLGQEETNSAPVSYPGIPQNEKRRTFQQTTKQLFAAIIVIYSKVFHVRTKVKRVKDAGLEIFGNDQILFEGFQNVWQALPGFYSRVLGPVSTTDDKLFRTCIVEKEKVFLAGFAANEKKEQEKQEKQKKQPERLARQISIRA
ncbi:hypothetical protein C8A05DRAFT_11464 [Staphylotrichum tortipilum]|uniref:Uncharacterized protein n=1 Tax=Staphylotrichum tortipilum TaxID=2831512 RepID=A0AAN6MV21_9PEZI|nr:hypothetical protein C8A05DRAFT_11464 [Staphylotrichum longicolle]